ncbi:FMN-binding protein [Clostridium formicaceticum]|uniref:Electron transport complex protein RnfG n=1 Tax=Clostridium formicaceticum TaxID=1497 RepID=A0AAC9RKN7_9CLOT|nr:FMN-binding protein [Clostridium formicaceticum]AOY76625.1 hypothetical protein BJL90_12580 [Clostridium formicaceticum]ARE87048.1 electron transport complex protein RnfG [Clostridium formicaceticum]
MKNKKVGLGFVFILVLIMLGITFYHTEDRGVQEVAGKLFPSEMKMKDITKQTKDRYVEENFPAVEEIYRVEDAEGQHTGNVFVVTPVGYEGVIQLAVGIDKTTGTTTGIHIIEHQETPSYGGILTENWFMERFSGKSAASFLNLVKLEEQTPQDILQITGATMTSQAVVNGVNAAIGTFNYLESGELMSAVPKEMERNLREEEAGIFYIHGGKKGPIKITMEELKQFPTVESHTTLRKSTGTEISITVEGPTLDVVLAHFGENLKDYNGIGVTARDGYYALVPKEIMDTRQVILGYIFDGEEIADNEKPIRVIIPDEFGVYWVKMVYTIDLYNHISEKDILSVKMFDALTRDITPYMYEYYGSKDASIEVGEILAKLEEVDSKGFFTMVSSDGLLKNETIAMVSSRYYIKTEGENAPMNIGPAFKLGMNVKNMAYFSTTKDAVVFPQEIALLTGTSQVEEYEGIPLKKLLEEVGFADVENKSFQLVAVEGEEVMLMGEDTENCILLYDENKTVTSVYKTSKGIEMIKDVLEINVK